MYLFVRIEPLKLDKANIIGHEKVKSKEYCIRILAARMQFYEKKNRGETKQLGRFVAVPNCFVVKNYVLFRANQAFKAR